MSSLEIYRRSMLTSGYDVELIHLSALAARLNHLKCLALAGTSIEVDTKLNTAMGKRGPAFLLIGTASRPVLKPVGSESLQKST
jgi:hypothetical protein